MTFRMKESLTRTGKDCIIKEAKRSYFAEQHAVKPMYRIILE